MVLAREFGATSVTLSGVSVVLGPAPPKAPAYADPDVALPILAEDAVAKEAEAAEREHYRKWQRITRSSGAPIPAYVKP